MNFELHQTRQSYQNINLNGSQDEKVFAVPLKYNSYQPVYKL